MWDATEGRFAHLEFGFSCMGYELPAAIGVRLAEPDRSKRVLSLLGDGTFLMAPTELVTAAQEKLPVTIVIPENHGYQVIHRLQMARGGGEFGNEFRYRDGSLEIGSGKPARLEGDYLQVDLAQIAAGLGARAIRATTADEVRTALAETRDHDGPVVLVVPVIPHADLPGSRRVVGRGPGRSLRAGNGRAAAPRVRRGSRVPEVVRMNRSPLDHGRLRARLASGEVTLGTFVGTASAVTAEVCAAAGADWLLLDLEHGAGERNRPVRSSRSRRPTAFRPSYASSPRPVSASAACSTWAPPGSCCRDSTRRPKSGTHSGT